ncbi:MAG: Mannosylglucosyl-3-phosphoglycerate phosphatase [Dehalococcoidia bacterium]|nr:Mannosylglucosyl-3-phosphoglycerate phosphatase [Bacillota bacterium]MBT9143226.1 Mannosylglucosyl-3-phosphoglycerate phosphatase [Bacillota bacterium]
MHKTKKTTKMKEDQMHKRIASVIMAAVLLVSGLMVAGCPPEAPVPGEGVGPTTITILHTGDLHGRLEPFKPWKAEEYIGGIARIATLVNQIRDEQPNTILLDAGDTIHGTNLANLSKGESVIAAMNAIGYTAMVVGNHDFNYELGVLQERAEQAEFPILGANVQYKIGEPVPFLPPHTIVEVGGLKIGIIGLVTTYTPIVTHPRNVEDLEFLDPVTVTREIVEQIGPQVDLIVLLAHIGTAEEEAVLREVPGIAVSVSGHTHEQRVDQIGNVILVDSAEYGKVLGRLDIVVENGVVTSFHHGFLPITPAIEEDAAVNAVITPYREALQAELAEVIGEAEVALDGERADIRSKETNLGNLVADVIRERAGADIAIQNGGGIRASIDVGPITLEEIFTVLPFDNYVVALELTGEAIWQALENGVSDESPTGAFPQVSGMTFTFDPARPSGDRVVEVTIGGTPLELDRTYIVATNDFLSGGGDKYTMLKEAKVVLETGDFLRDAVAAYIREKGKIHPVVEGRIKIISHLTILHTNDLHGRAAPFDRPDVTGTVGGLARIATVINEIRAEGQPVLVLDSGDTLHGTGIAHYTQGLVMIEAMNAIGYDAMVVGNHEFNWGLTPLFASQETATFPFLSANLVYTETGERLFAPYKIIERAGVRIGILAVSATPNLQHDEVIGIVSRRHPVEVAQEFVAALQGEVDLMIVLSHLGHFEDRTVAMFAPGIDLILSGHTHFLLTEPLQIGGALIVENGWLGEQIGRLDMTIEDGELIAIEHRLIRIDDSIAHDPDVEAIVAAAYADNPHLQEIVGYAVDHLESSPFVLTPAAKALLDRAQLEPLIAAVLQDVLAGTVVLPLRATDSSQETALGNIVADSIRLSAAADIAIVHSGWIREGIAKGAITKGDIFRIYPFDMPILVHSLTGVQIVQLLERGVAAIPVPEGGFLQVSGLRFSFNPLPRRAERVEAYTSTEWSLSWIVLTPWPAPSSSMVSLCVTPEYLCGMPWPTTSGHTHRFPPRLRAGLYYRLPHE